MNENCKCNCFETLFLCRWRSLPFAHNKIVRFNFISKQRILVTKFKCISFKPIYVRKFSICKTSSPNNVSGCTANGRRKKNPLLIFCFVSFLSFISTLNFSNKDRAFNAKRTNLNDLHFAKHSTLGCKNWPAFLPLVLSHLILLHIVVHIFCKMKFS